MVMFHSYVAVSQRVSTKFAPSRPDTDGFNDRPANFDGEAASMGGQHIHAEHDPHPRGERGGADHSTPDQAQLTDVVNGEPIGEGLDQVHLANQKGHAGIGFGTPIVFPEDQVEKGGQACLK